MGATQATAGRGGGPPQLSEDFRRFADRSHDVVYRYDVEARRYQFWNEVGLLTYGGEDDARHPTPQDVLERILPEDREAVRQAARRSRQAGARDGEVEYRIRHGDGTVRWMHDRWIVLRDAEGRAVAIEGVVRDDTGRKRAQLALEERERELEEKQASLEDVIGALRVLLREREQDHAELHRSLARSVRESLEPYLARLRSTSLSPEQDLLVGILEAACRELAAAGAEPTGNRQGSLTAAESQVAELVRLGRSTKEIATALNLSPRTVESHRYRIRKKLGMSNSGQPLRSRLATGDRAAAPRARTLLQAWPPPDPVPRAPSPAPARGAPTTQAASVARPCFMGVDDHGRRLYPRGRTKAFP